MAETYPASTSAAVSAVMRGNRKRDTRPELRLRRALHAAGLRYRVNRLVHIEGQRPIRPDIVFGPTKVAVFVHGCFWHSCPQHGNQPGGRNAAYWEAKLRRNAERDEQQTALLAENGWWPVTVWEHDDPDRAAELIADLVARRRRGAEAEGSSDAAGAGRRNRQAGRRQRDSH